MGVGDHGCVDGGEQLALEGPQLVGRLLVRRHDVLVVLVTRNAHCDQMRNTSLLLRTALSTDSSRGS